MIESPATVAVVAMTEAWASRAQTLARELALEALTPGTTAANCQDFELLLQVADDGLSLQPTGRMAPAAVRVDWGDARMRHRRRGGQNELLGRAVGVGKKPGLRVLDATAGLGRDAAVLADLRCQLILCERNPLIACLLRSGLDRAMKCGDPWLADLAGRLSLFAGDARTLPPPRLAQNDVIYVDPMFPPRHKRAAVKKEMVVFQSLLEQTANDSESLLQWALAQDAARVVVKRPLKETPLAGLSPSHCISGKAVRFDVYVRRALQ